MHPTLVDGELILIDPGVPARVGDIVVARHPTKAIDIVKTVTEVADDGSITLWSPQGSHSGRFGPVLGDAVHGRATVSLSRRRRLPSHDHAG